VNRWAVTQTPVPALTMGVDTTDPASAMFTTGNFPGASSTDLTNARNIYGVLTGRITAITANANLSENGKYVYAGPSTQRFPENSLGSKKVCCSRGSLGPHWSFLKLRNRFFKISQRLKLCRIFDNRSGIQTRRPEIRNQIVGEDGSKAVSNDNNSSYSLLLWRFSKRTSPR
jgi:hypothetical protein